MIRAILAVITLLIGIAIGSCTSLSHSSTRPRQDWHPVAGRRYERPGSRARTVVEVWPRGVQYRWDDGRERSCTVETWRRWAERKGE